MLALLLLLSSAPAAESWYLVGQHYHTTTDTDFSHDPAGTPASASYDPAGIETLVENGAKAGLDAMIVTEHNTIATCFDPAFANRRPVLICGEEWTTKRSLHVGLIHPPVDNAGESFIPPSPGESHPQAFNEFEAAKLIADVHRRAAARGHLSLAVINHPGYDMYQPRSSLGADAAEVIVPDYENPERARRWWLKRLIAGERIVALAGSDYHACEGWDCVSHGDFFREWFWQPVNLVLARSNNPYDIVEAIARGQVVALASRKYRDVRIELEADFAGRSHRMGETVPVVRRGERLGFRLRIRGGAGLHAVIFGNAGIIRRIDLGSKPFETAFELTKKLERDAVHVELFEYGDTIPVAIANPIYL